MTNLSPVAAPTNPVLPLLRAWDRFWFTPADPTVLGLIRIFAGLVVLYVHAAYTYDLGELLGPDAWVDSRAMTEHRTEFPWPARSQDWSEMTPTTPLPPADAAEAASMGRWGLNPRQAYAHGYYVWSLWFHVTDPRQMAVAHAAVLAILFLFTVGCCTRVTSVLAWLAAVSYIHRTPTSLFGMDTMTNILLIYLMIGPSGAALSVDRLAAAWLAGRRGGKHSGHGFLHAGRTTPPAPSVSANLALRLMQVHFCLIYFAAGLSKLLGRAWWNGTAVWGTFANPEFAPLHDPLYAAALAWLCRHRWAWELVMSGGVVYTLALEISFPFLVWDRRFRGLMVLGAVFLHTAIALAMGLVPFGLAMLALVLSFLPADAVRRWFGKLDRLCRRPAAPGPLATVPGRAA